MEYKPDGPVVVLSPHLDDAVLSAWSVLRRPGEVAVVNVCSGAPPPGTVAPWDRVTGAADSAARMGERLAEDVAALAGVGRSPLNLGFLDHQYRDGEPLDAPRLRAELERALPVASALVAPAGLGAHADHVAVRELALELGREGGIPVELYADLPYAARLGWPSWVTGAPPQEYLQPDARWREHMASASCDASALQPHVERLSDEDAAGKLEALMSYRTQFAALDGGPHELIRNPSVLGFEVRWRVSPDGAAA